MAEGGPIGFRGGRDTESEPFSPEDSGRVSVVEAICPSAVWSRRRMYQLPEEAAGIEAGVEAAANVVTGGVNPDAAGAEPTGLVARDPTRLAETGLAETGLAETGLAETGLAATELAALVRADTKSSTGPLPLATHANHFSCNWASESYP